MNRLPGLLFRPVSLLVPVVTLLLVSPVRGQVAAPNDAGVAFNHLHLSVTDTTLHKHIWTEVFGGAVVELEGYAVVRLPGTLVFMGEGEPTRPSSQTALDHVGFRVRNLDAVLTAWQAMGYEAGHRAIKSDGRATAALTLPDGLAVELEEDATLSATAALDHVHFATPQYRTLPAWYADLFGATEVKGEEVMVRVPGAVMRFSDAEEARAPTEDTVLDHIGFEVEDMDALVEKLRARDIEIVFGPRYIERLDLWVVFFVDPSGVLVEASEGLDVY